MNTYLNPYVFTSGIILFTIIIVGLIFLKKQKNHKPDYYTLFILGILWLPIGISMENYALFFMGLAFLIAGILNKDKWRKPEENWKNLTENEKKLKILLLIILGLLLISGLVTWLMLGL